MGIFDKLTQMKSESAEANLKAVNEFMEKNKLRPEVVTLASGLQYEIMKEGSGEKPKATSTVSCHYHGTLLNGKVFDSSVQRGQPASFPLNRVISGWTEALKLMPVGSKWKLFLPPNLAYGNQQVGSDIGPN